MEAIKKQATRLREQVAKQQQALLKHLGHFSSEGIIVDEAELQCYQHLQNLYNSTRVAEGAENQSANNYVGRAVLQFGASHNLMEKEKETLVEVLHNQVSKPLRGLITEAPLEDARHLTHRYDKLRQEVEAQAAEVLRRWSKPRDSEISADSCMKLRAAEARLTELKSTTMALGREATAAMSSVENQQQYITVQNDAERCYHQHVLAILDKLHTEMILEEQLNESSSQSATTQRDMSVPPVHENNTSNGSDNHVNIYQKDGLFIAKVIHPFDTQAEGELSLSTDDFVVVRQVAPTGWSEGESKGKSGLFPSAYIEKHEKAPASKLTEGRSTS